MHKGENYEDFLKWGELFLGHFLIINELEGFFPQLCNLTPLPTITHKRVAYKTLDYFLLDFEHVLMWLHSILISAAWFHPL